MWPFSLACGALYSESADTTTAEYSVMLNTHRLCAVLLAVLCTPCVVNAQVLRCEDAQGNVTYTDAECPKSQSGKEILPAISREEKAQLDAQYQQALALKQEEQTRLAERDAAQRKAEAERAAAEAAQRPPVIVPPPPPSTTANPQPPAYGPLYPPHRPPMQRPTPVPPGPDTKAPGYNCNVFKCYDGKGNTWNRP